MKEENNTKTNNRYGVIANQEREIIFSRSGDFSFDFIIHNADMYECTDIIPVNDYLEADTLSGEKMYIFLDKIIHHLGRVSSLNTAIYTLGKEIKKPVGIRFSGGTLNKLFSPKALKFEYEKEGIQYSYLDDTIHSEFWVDERKFRIEVGSNVRQTTGVSGSLLLNNNVTMDVIVEEGFDISELLKLLNVSRNACQFLCFRKNVVFEGISILEKSIEHSPLGYESTADIFMKEDSEPGTGKEWFFNFTFENIESKVGDIFKLIYSVKNGDIRFPLDIIPTDDERAKWIKFEDIKNICTAADIEIERWKIKTPVDDSLEDLIKTIKVEVKNYCSEKGINEKKYNQICRTFNSWKTDESFGNKYQILYDKYKDIVFEMPCNMYSEAEFQTLLRKFIGIRHKHTHGKYINPDADMANVANIMIGIIYCSIFDYIGIPKEKIKEMIKDKRLY